MKIGIVHRNLHLLGGGSRWVVEVARHLTMRGHEVEIFSEKVSAPSLLPKSYQGLIMARKLAKQVKKIKDTDCVLLSSDMEFSRVFKENAPLIGVVHEVAFLRRLHAYGLRRLLQAPVRNAGYMDFSGLDAIVVNSKFTANNVKEIFPETHVVYPGVNHNFFTPGGMSAERYLLYVSRFSPGEKNHLLAIEIAKQLHAKLFLIGSLGSTEYLTQLPRASEVEIKTDVCDTDLLSYYRKCSVYLHPSIHEAFGLTVLEAMACGKPVVVHKEGGGAREIAEGYGLMGGDIDEWLEVVNSLLSSSEKSKIIGEKCRRRALMFSWDKTAESLERLMERLVK